MILSCTRSATRVARPFSLDYKTQNNNLAIERDKGPADQTLDFVCMLHVSCVCTCVHVCVHTCACVYVCMYVNSLVPRPFPAFQCCMLTSVCNIEFKSWEGPGGEARLLGNDEVNCLHA